MKKSFIILAIAVAIGATFASCTASKGGCKSTQGYVGYGGGR